MLLFFKLLLAAALTLAACRAGLQEAVMMPTATTLRVEQTTPVPTASRQVQPIATAQSADAPSTPAACQATAGQMAVSHQVTATINYSHRRVDVIQRVHYINRTNEDLQQIVFNAESNRWNGVFTLNGASLSGDAELAAYELTGKALTLELAAPLRPGCAVDLVFDYRLIAHPIGESGATAFSGYLGYSERQFNLGNWLLTAAVRRDGEWVTREATVIGEQTVLDVADWIVDLELVEAPEGVVLAAPGSSVQITPTFWRYRHPNARDFTVSMSPLFSVETRDANGIAVELYSFAGADTDGAVDAGAHALDVAARSLSMYADLFGPYPAERFVIVEGDFPDGMEFTGLVFVSGDWFRTYTGSPASYLTMITVHEVSHQWWYARVGSDQALTPWLDEALATYSEYIFFEEYYPQFKDWWWRQRIERFVTADYRGPQVDSTVYEFGRIRDYINAVYLRGARLLHDLRGDLGTDAFFDWLRRYATAGTDRVVGPALWWSLLTPEQFAQTAATRSSYFRPPAYDDLAPGVGG